jgi:hypothetical protein
VKAAILIAGIALGALVTNAYEVRLRASAEIAHERALGALRVEMAHVSEDAYHDGERDGYATGIAESRIKGGK